LILEVQPISTNFSLRSTMVGTPVSGRPTLSPSPPGPVTTASSPTATATFPLLVNCPHPGDWVSVIIEPGDTVERLANAYSTTEDDITRNNCLLIDTLITGTILWLPPVEKIGKFNQPAKSCGPPDIWVSYLVKPGDTLFYLSVTTGATTKAAASLEPTVSKSDTGHYFCTSQRYQQWVSCYLGS
jgi:LysM repeat protein